MIFFDFVVQDPAKQQDVGYVQQQYKSRVWGTKVAVWPKVTVLVKIAVRPKVAVPAQCRRAMLCQYFPYRKRFAYTF